MQNTVSKAPCGDETVEVRIGAQTTMKEHFVAPRVRQVAGGFGYRFGKRLFDIVMSFLAIVILALPMLILAIVVRLDSPGPALYKQERLGKNGKPFKVLKFRSMRLDAEKTGAQWAAENDPRVTRFGRILRKCSIDELPQLFNVFKGNMSLVGPRPPLPSETAEYTDYDKLRLLVTPGITCTWQIAPHRNDMPFSKWVEMDLTYIENRTTLLDIKIILKTPIAMLKATGR